MHWIPADVSHHELSLRCLLMPMAAQLRSLVRAWKAEVSSRIVLFDTFMMMLQAQNQRAAEQRATLKVQMQVGFVDKHGHHRQ